MKKMLALLVALVMALSCTLALAEEDSGFPGITISAELDVDREAAGQYLEMFGMEGDELATANGVVALLDALNEKTVITAEGIQYELGLNDSAVLSLGGSLNDKGVTLVSSLFPNYAITVSMATILDMVQKALASIPTDENSGLPFDVNAVAGAVSGYAETFIDSCTGAVSMGDTEVGEFEYEGHTFNAKTAINVDMKALADAVNTFVDQLMNDETVKGAIEAMKSAGVSVDTPEEVNKLDPETAPNVEGWVYTYVDEEGNASDEVYVLVNVTPKDATEAATIVHTLAIGGNVTVTVEIPAESTTVQFSEETTENGFKARLIANANGMFFAVGFTVDATDNIAANVDIYFLSDVKPLVTANLTIEMSGELTMDVSGEGKTVVAIEELMGEGSDQPSDAVTGLMMDVFMNGLGTLMNGISENVPELGDAIGSLAGSLMGA